MCIRDRSEGAVPHGSIAECVKASEVVITMVGFPKDVEEVYFAPGNILDSAAKGMTLIDMTTTSPTLAQRIYQEGAARGLRVLDAPVTGGDSGARAGTLSILVGGDQADQADPGFNGQETHWLIRLFFTVKQLDRINPVDLNQ